jgi:hypothetical protein
VSCSKRDLRTNLWIYNALLLIFRPKLDLQKIKTSVLPVTNMTELNDIRSRWLHVYHEFSEKNINWQFFYVLHFFTGCLKKLPVPRRGLLSDFRSAQANLGSPPPDRLESPLPARLKSPPPARLESPPTARFESPFPSLESPLLSLKVPLPSLSSPPPSQ